MRLFIPLLLWILSVPALTFAQPESYDDLVKSALEAYRSEHFVEARSLFERAHSAAPSARTLRGMGMCSFNLGDYVDATFQLEAALDEESRPLSTEQRAAADDLLVRASAEIGRFRANVTPYGAEVSVDGRPALRSVRGDVLMAPGSHSVDFSAPGYTHQTRTLTVSPGDRAALEVALVPVTVGTPVAAAPAPPAKSVVRARWPLRLGIAGVAVGGLGLGLFGVAGGLALHDKSQLERACPGPGCPPALHGDVDTYERRKLLSGAGLYTGAAFLCLGALGFYLHSQDKRTSAVELAPVVGLGYVGLRGAL
jgi:tetratricopeptide (TPR) repeat protein